MVVEDKCNKYKVMNIEQKRIANSGWKKWGPYMSDRQWGTVREDYSPNGDAWESTTHDMARSIAWRWGEEGIGGISDDQQLLCFAISLWNKKDPIIKERYFGLTNTEGNHGEDVKEMYYYLDSTPSHSYMKMLYKYPQREFPYEWLVSENKSRTRNETEFEIMDTAIFNDDKYFDVFVEYAKAGENDTLIKLTIHNRNNEEASLHILPTLWFRNTWSWSYDDYKPQMMLTSEGNIEIIHRDLGNYTFYTDAKNDVLFCDNETNLKRFYGGENRSAFTKDAINDYLVHNHRNAVNKNAIGTKAAVNYDIMVNAGQSVTLRFRLAPGSITDPFKNFDDVFNQRKGEADEFYEDLQQDIQSDDEKLVQRQAYAGLLWSKQFYYYNVDQWLNGDLAHPALPHQRRFGRNHQWRHLNNADIISMPDKWEFPWYASWDLAFHSVSFAGIDPLFAKQQLLLLTKEWYMHPNGQLPAYEWNFNDVNPPVHAWATWRVYEIEKENRNGKGDLAFLESVFHKMLLNFSWWVNRKDAEGTYIFEGGFLGLDNIGVIDRNQINGDGCRYEQADATSWMAMFSLNMMRIALELATNNPVYQEMAIKFFDHFLYMGEAIEDMYEQNGLWDEEDQFFYDVLKMQGDAAKRLKVRSMVGLIPLFAVEVLDEKLLEQVPEFTIRLQRFLERRPRVAGLVSRWKEKNAGQKHLLSLLPAYRMKKLLNRLLDENEFLSDYGIRTLSKHYEQNPYTLVFNGSHFTVEYSPGESTTDLFGGNSNWRGPIWLPLNFLIIESLQCFHDYYTDDLRIEFPRGKGEYLTLKEIADEISKRLSGIFLRDKYGRRAVFGENEKLQYDANFNNYILFHEYFHGDTAKGLGASHQTGWTALIANLLHPLKRKFDEPEKKRTANFNHRVDFF
jgi:Mannosylglycerate hydrolase MGH1-like glycoside hydrolase domain